MDLGIGNIKMYEQLFESGSFDEISLCELIYYNVTLKIKIGEFEPGTKFPSANIDFETGELQLWENDDNYHSFNLGLVIL